MADQKQNPNGLPPSHNHTPGKTNWGLWILAAVIIGILSLAFMSDDGFGGSTKKITLEEFTKDCNEGKIILHDQKKFPIEVTCNDSNSKATLTAYRLKNILPPTQLGTFLVRFTDSEEMNNLLNSYGIADSAYVPEEAAGNEADTAEATPSGEENAAEVELQSSHVTQALSKLIPQENNVEVMTGEDFRDLCKKGLILFAKDGAKYKDAGITLTDPVIIVDPTTKERALLGHYRKISPLTTVEEKNTEPVLVPFNRSFQGAKVKELLGNNATYKVESNTWEAILINCLPIVIIIVILIFIFRAQSGGPSGAMKFARSRARLLDPSSNNITFKDVAGISEAKEELWEIVEFLRNPRKFRNLGGTIPKGVLMVGPPGTGKTLLAKAIAGEADVPFYTISGSDFVEMFVGVGASRVRDMFAEAKKNSPCLIFIDEIDAVGRHRGHGVGGGHDEREQTLNAMLVEMDGFTPNENVIVIAATNRVDVLDPALLRPGRFDRQVVVNLPDAAGREQILKVHVRKIKLDPSVQLAPIARATTGFSGAELANLVNEAALIAARKNQSTVKQADLEEAREKVRWGRERRSLEISDREKYMTAVHEAGHALCLLKTPLAKTLPLHKVTIIPRGPALGVTMMLPDEDKHSEYKSEMLDYIVMAMGGRCAEQVVFGDVSGGARGDIQQATAIARKMVCVYGMSEKLGPVEYGSNHSEVFLARDISHTSRNYSERTAQIIDEEIQRIVEENYTRALNILTENKDKLILVADKLVEYETLSGEHIAELVETGTMLNPPDKEIPPPMPEEDDAETAPPAEQPDSTDEDAESQTNNN